ncbi:Hypothetical protein SMAX5B_019365 [Scophthalmus maximus]|uniref:Uncharacterized protein n=1 Tax=Scophthalmus maximus TaxID=52904 RepID=A0A2U9B7N9_SCOMX|nr:Hypothetical protein SMAX5B_019365 [Scophthalmus maximus]
MAEEEMIERAPGKVVHTTLEITEEKKEVCTLKLLCFSGSERHSDRMLFWIPLLPSTVFRANRQEWSITITIIFGEDAVTAPLQNTPGGYGLVLEENGVGKSQIVAFTGSPSKSWCRLTERSQEDDEDVRETLDSRKLRAVFRGKARPLVLSCCHFLLRLPVDVCGGNEEASPGAFSETVNNKHRLCHC